MTELQLWREEEAVRNRLRYREKGIPYKSTPWYMYMYVNKCGGGELNSPGGVGGCGCESVEEGELCGTVAAEGRGQSQ